MAARYPALSRALSQRSSGAGEPTIHDAATAAVEGKGSGASLDAGVAERVGAHLGADFSAVHVHDDPLSREATQAMGARAFAYGGDVFLGPGERGSDLGLMAHELTHVVQQGAAGRRMPQRAVQVGDANSPAEREADQVAAEVTGGQGAQGARLVDGGPVASGQMLKSQFFDQLRTQVMASAEAELGPVYAPVGCPPIEQFFSRSAGEPAAACEARLQRIAPALRSAKTAAEMMPQVVARLRDGVRLWRDTGQVPPELGAVDPAAAAASPGGAQAQALCAPGGGETLVSLEAELGPGQPLDGATASRMSGALGVDVSAARIHTGAIAARKAADRDAVAFAVGGNVVMGAGAPPAGTIEGDALLAHELAHTAQQAGAAADLVARRQPIRGESAAAEQDADAAAAGAVAQLHAPKPGLVQRLAGALQTGLQLQRCDKNKDTKGAKPAKLPKLLTDFTADFAGTEDMIANDKAAMKLVNEAADAGVAFGGYAEDGPSKDTWPYTIGNTVYIPKTGGDKVVAVSGFLFELNNALRKPKFAALNSEASKGNKGNLSAEEYAKQTVQLEVEGMLRLGEIWFEMKKGLGGGHKFDKYDNDFYLSEYQSVKDGTKSEAEVVDEVLARKYTDGVDKGKTVKQYYMEQYLKLSGGK